MRPLITTLLCVWFVHLLSAQYSLPVTINEGARLQSFITYDVDLDGDNDLVASSPGKYDSGCSCLIEGGAFWFENLDGNGQNFEKHTLPIQGNRAFRTFPTDIDQDGDTDFIINEGHTAGVEGTFFLENLNGDFTTWDEQYLTGKNGKTIIGDYDGDGDEDIIIQSTGEAYLVRHADGAGTFEQVEVFSTVIYGTSNYMHFTDIDLDNDLDILWSTDKYDEDARIWSFNNITGDGNMSADIIDNSLEFAEHMQIGDLNLDGYDDMVYDTKEGIWVDYNDGGFFQYDDGEEILDLPGDLKALELTDVNYDGLLDIVYVFDYDEDIYILLNYGTEFLGPIPANNQQVGIHGFGVGDLDGDGDDDLIYSSATDLLYVQYNKAVLSGGNLSNIKGNVFWDENENGIWDTTELTLQGQPISLEPQGYDYWTNASGTFGFGLTPNQPYQIEYTPFPNWNLTTTNTLSGTTPDTSACISQEFGVVPNGSFYDGSVHFSSGILRCNTEPFFWINWNNLSSTYVSGTIEVEIDEIVTFLDSGLPPETIDGQTYTWSFNEVQPFQNQSLWFKIGLPGVEAIGDELNFSVTIRFEDEDGEVVETISSEILDNLLCAYDPNDKLVANSGPSSTWMWIEDTLEYTVRFQNTGNDTAFTVRVDDYLDLNLDFNTFEPIASSHPCEISLADNGSLVYLFEDILLPDSTTNFDGSQGFFTFKIQAKAGLPDSTVVENSAGIFFDFNPPIITNTVSTYIVDEIPFDIQITPPACTGEATGEINVGIDVDPEYFNYSWNINVDGPVAEGLEQGIYQLQIVDPNGNMVLAKQWQLLDPAPISANFDVFDAINGYSNGAIQFVVQGGTPPYALDWDIEPEPNVTNNIIHSIPAGDHLLLVTDANGCEELFPVSVGEVTYAVEVTQVDPSCADPSSGAIDIVIDAPNPNQLNFSWNTGATTSGLNSLEEGNYSVTVTANNNILVYADTFQLQLDTDLASTASNTAAINDLNNGTASVSVSGGLPPYQYTWSFPMAPNEPIVTDLEPGTYTVTITDALGECQTVETIVIDHLVYTAVVTSLDPSCFGLADGAIYTTISPEDGTTFEYLWNTGAITPDLENIPAGSYTLSLLLQDGSVVLQETATIDSPDPIIITTASTPSLPDLPTGTASAVPTGGQAPYTITWQTTPPQTGGTATDLAAGTYEVIVTDAVGCTQSALVEIEDLVDGLKSISGDWDLQLFPNPASDYIHLEIQGAQPRIDQITIMDAFGRLRYLSIQPSNVPGTVSTVQLPSGWYLLEIRTADGSISKPFIIID